MVTAIKRNRFAAQSGFEGGQDRSGRSGHWCVLLLSFFLLLFGCGEEITQSNEANRPTAKTTNDSNRAKRARNNKSTRRKRGPAPRSPRTPPPTDSRSSLADLVDESLDDKRAEIAPPINTPVFTLDPQQGRDLERQAEASGLRILHGRHLMLITDAPSRREIDELPGVFDQGVVQWAEYFDVEKARVASWKMCGYLIAAKDRFRRTGMFREDLPAFLHGYQMQAELWLYDQPSDYYRRHLLLHEGVHGFMRAYLGGAGPPWYMEGVAELLATHRWSEGKLKINHFPDNRRESEYWGRIKTIRDDFAASKAKSLREVLALPERAFLETGPYAWSWAAAAFFDGHARYRDAFRKMTRYVRLATFSHRLFLSFEGRDDHLQEEWELFVANLDYGYDAARAEVQYQETSAVPAGGAETIIAADRGWQSSPWTVEAGNSYRLQARGHYQVGSSTVNGTLKPWWCEPNGVTIEYHQGRPLGLLLYAIGGPAPDGGITPLAYPRPLGPGALLTVDRTGPLFFRINESAGGLADNAGELTLSIVPQGAE